jgi:hypothetical protein
MEHPHPSIDVFGRSKERGEERDRWEEDPTKTCVSEEISGKRFPPSGSESQEPRSHFFLLLAF